MAIGENFSVKIAVVRSVGCPAEFQVLRRVIRGPTSVWELGS